MLDVAVDAEVACVPVHGQCVGASVFAECKIAVEVGSESAVEYFVGVQKLKVIQQG